MSISAMIKRYGKDTEVYRRVSTQLPDGTMQDTWPVEDTDIGDFKAWPQAASSRVIERYGARELIVTHSCYVYIGLNLQQGDRLYIDGKFYAVRGVEDQAGLQRMWLIGLEELKP